MDREHIPLYETAMNENIREVLSQTNFTGLDWVIVAVSIAFTVLAMVVGSLLFPDRGKAPAVEGSGGNEE